MNLQQLEYIIAVNKYQHFVKAAENCFVTQATLSMMIKKLEDELKVKIFNRSRHPVTPTEIGKKIITQAKIILLETKKLKEIIAEETNEIKGILKIGIIPTLAPYLLPLFLHSFLQKYPEIKMQVFELNTSDIVKKLEKHELDAGLLAIPLNNNALIENVLFYEEFVVYSAIPKEKIKNKKYVIANDLDINKLWLLEEGHCFRSQVVNLCELKNREKAVHQLDFAAGSIQTLKKIVEMQKGITILPALALADMTLEQLSNIRHFKKPSPVREIGLVINRFMFKDKLINTLKEEILLHIPAHMKTATEKEIISI
jgi:LysR family hydrogen peroxide-inducible transcriptional activator